MLPVLVAMTATLKDFAIKNALENNWQEAYKINQQLILDNPTDVDTLNRLAFALLKLGNFKKAKSIYKKVIGFDKTNPIALKNLKKIESLPKKLFSGDQKANSSNGYRLDEIFIEEAGKTKIVELKNITDKTTLSLLQPGDNVQICIKRSKIFIQTNDKRYIGMLPDNIGTRLIPFIKGGNEYQAYVKSVDDKNVAVFLKEVKRAKRFKFQPSFSTNTLPSLNRDENDYQES